MRKVSVTVHAAERWVQRVEPALSIDEALRRIEELWPQASKLRDKSRDGAIRYRLAEPLAELFIRQERDAAVVVSCIGREEIERMSEPIEPEIRDLLIDEDKWPPHGEITLLVRVEWNLRGGTRKAASQAVAALARNRITAALEGAETGNAAIDCVRIGEQGTA